MSSAEKPAYPAACPQCSLAAAWPFAAGTCERLGVIVVKLRCHQCGHEWSADAPKSPMAVVKPFDRGIYRRRPA